MKNMIFSSEYLRTSIPNEDLYSTEGDIHHVLQLDQVFNNITCRSSCLLIDSVKEVKDGLYTFTKVLEASSQLNESLPCCDIGSTLGLYIILTKERVEHSANSQDENIRKLEKGIIPLHYYLKKTNIGRIYFIFKNAKTSDELCSFKFLAIFSYLKLQSNVKEYNLYYDTDPIARYFTLSFDRLNSLLDELFSSDELLVIIQFFVIKYT